MGYVEANLQLASRWGGSIFLPPTEKRRSTYKHEMLHTHAWIYGGCCVEIWCQFLVKKDVTVTSQVKRYVQDRFVESIVSFHTQSA